MIKVRVFFGIFLFIAGTGGAFADSAERRICADIGWSRIAFLLSNKVIPALKWADFSQAETDLAALADSGDERAKTDLDALRDLTVQERRCATLIRLRTVILSKSEPEALAALKKRFIAFFASPEAAERIIAELPLTLLRSAAKRAHRFADFTRQESALEALVQRGDSDAAEALSTLRGRNADWKRKRTEEALISFKKQRWHNPKEYQRLLAQLRGLYSNQPGHVEKFIAELEKIRPPAVARRTSPQVQKKTAPPAKAKPRRPGSTTRPTARRLPRGHIVQLFTGKFVKIENSEVTVTGRFIDSTPELQTIRCRLDNLTKGVQYVGSSEALTQQLDRLILERKGIDLNRDVKDEDLRARLNQRVRVGAYGGKCTHFQFLGNR